MPTMTSTQSVGPWRSPAFPTSHIIMRNRPRRRPWRHTWSRRARRQRHGRTFCGS